MATLNKNFRIKNGLVVEGSTATVNGQNILTETGSDQYILNLIGGETLVKSVDTNVFNVDNAGNLTVNANVFDSYGSASAAESAANSYTDDEILTALTTAQGYATTAQSNAETFATNAINALDTDDIEEGLTSLYFTNQRALDATSAAYDAAGSAAAAQSAAQAYADGLAVNYDAAGSASTAEAAANSYTDTAINNLDTDDIEEGVTNVYYTDARARGAVDTQINGGLTYDSNTGLFAVDTNSIATQSYVDTAVSNLVDGAPALLDTLNELAAAINDDASFATTITNGLSEKVAKSGDTMTGALVLHADPLNALEAATKQYVDAAEAAAQAAAESTAQGALDDALDGTTSFTALDVSSVSRQIASTTGNIVTVAATTALSWAKADYRSAKIIVKAKNGSHTHVSEVIISLDTSDNIALNEYAITTTNGSLMTIDADISGTDIRLRVTPAHDNTEVMSHATLLV